MDDRQEFWSSGNPVLSILLNFKYMLIMKGAQQVPFIPGKRLSAAKSIRGEGIGFNDIHMKGSGNFLGGVKGFFD